MHNQAPNGGLIVVMLEIGKPSKHFLHIQLVHALLLHISLSSHTHVDCMHFLLSFRYAPDIMSGKPVQLHRTCVCPPMDEKKQACIGPSVDCQSSRKQSQWRPGDKQHYSQHHWHVS